MKILIVDDSKLSRSMVKQILLEEPYIILEARDGDEALELFTREKPDLVLLDLTMPGMNGLDVLTRIREINGGAKIIIATADVQEMTRKEAKKLGAAAYVTKPFQADELRGLIEKLGEENT
jgi:two-component system, chemotaxis family, chemotaxis protein CheY